MATESAAVKPSTIGAWRRVAGPGAADRGVKDEMRATCCASSKRASRSSPAFTATKKRCCRRSPTPSWRGTTSSCWACAARPRAASCAAWSNFLDPEIPYIAGCEIHDHPLHPICRACRDIVAERGDDTPIAWLTREDRYVEKLATPDVTIADIIGDVDPIKAARGGRNLSDELTMHYGLLPRANRGIFAINELPDLAGKIQVGLFNIMQEGDVQIKGYPIRLPLDVLLVFTANPEDYTARGKIVTPLKDRVGSEIRTHYPATVEEGMAITAQEAWIAARLRPQAARAGLHSRSRRASRLSGARRQARRQPLRRQPAPAHRLRSKPSSAAPSSAPRETTKATSPRAWPTSTRPFQP